ncbi:MAG: peptide chain release factor 2 [Holosporaceae bacterium]|nr:peptide chain release factor 2 [Holosporaceae bacterium]
MKEETRKIFESIDGVFDLLRRFLDLDALVKQRDELGRLSESEDLWQDQERARDLLRRKSSLEEEISRFAKAENEFSDLRDLLQLAEAENDSALMAEIEGHIRKFHEYMKTYQLECFFSSEADHFSCYLEVHAGAGGTEAQDWAQMLLRMYARWSEKHGYSMEIIEESAGEEAGLKSSTIKINGKKAYGWLKSESGIHRLVRISPFDSNARRHTSFASVGVYPVVDDSINIAINDADLRIDTYRSSGAGGQHVNKTESAIRITHLPTGIVVQCQTDRSQHRNRAIAFDMLRSRLYELELRKKEEKLNSIAKDEIGWGYQIRSYVLQPYQMVKDLRTGCENGNVSAVLDGDIDEFLQTSLSAKVHVAEKLS